MFREINLQYYDLLVKSYFHEIFAKENMHGHDRKKSVAEVCS